MALPNVSITRKGGMLGRVAPAPDRVIGIVLTGAAVATKIALSEVKQIFGTSSLAAIGITEAENPFALAEIKAFYAQAGEGAELNFMLVSDATLLADICDVAQNIAKKLLDQSEGRITHLFVSRKLPAGYVMNRTDGLDTDVWNAVTKMQALAAQYDSENQPFVGVLPGIGFQKANAAALRSLGTMTAEHVALLLGADTNAGKAAIGALAGWIAKHPVHQNIGRVASGSVLELAYFTDGTAVKDYDSGALGSIHDKRYILFRRIFGKSGHFFSDDPCATAVSSDFSSISWNAVINKAKRLAYAVLVDRLNDNVTTDPDTGTISAALAADWEGDVENAINRQMTAKSEITAVKCTIDRTESNLATDQVKASLRVVRKGQAKTISVEIGYSAIV